MTAAMLALLGAAQEVRAAVFLPEHLVGGVQKMEITKPADQAKITEGLKVAALTAEAECLAQQAAEETQQEVLAV